MNGIRMQENCAKLVGRCFAEATGSDLALVSLGTWISGNGLNQNNDCVSMKMYAGDITVDGAVPQHRFLLLQLLCVLWK